MKKPYLFILALLEEVCPAIVMCTKIFESFSANLASSSPFHLYVKIALILPVTIKIFN